MRQSVKENQPSCLPCSLIFFAGLFVPVHIHPYVINVEFSLLPLFIATTMSDHHQWWHEVMGDL